MGEDKALLPFSDSPTLTQYQLKRFKKLFKNVFISCKIKDKFDFNAQFIEDEVTQDIFAPTTAFIAIFKKLQDEKIFVISVDTPFITENEISKILSNDNSLVDATVATTSMGTQPMCGIYHRSLEKKFIQMLKSNNHKLNFLLKNANTKYIHFENDKPFFNLNNPQEYKEALTII